jgi:hypothetical protein
MSNHNYNMPTQILLVFVRIFEQISKDFNEGVNDPGGKRPAVKYWPVPTRRL